MLAKKRDRKEARERYGRDMRKLHTRQALMEAALTLMNGGRGFAGLSLREVTREAGVVPTAFYRHFRDMDEMGLALVEEAGQSLRRLLREPRQERLPLTDVIRSSVEIFKQFVKAHRLHFLFVASERSGGSPVIRAAVNTQVTHFVNEMALDLRALQFMPQLSNATLQMLCGLVVTTMLNATMEFLDLPPGKPDAEMEMTENFVRQLRLIFLGATVWKD